jgi:hypothetical protein
MHSVLRVLLIDIICIILLLHADRKHNNNNNNNNNNNKGKAIPVTGRGDPWGCEMLRFPYLLDSRLTDGREVVSLTHQPLFNPKKIPGTHFC